MSNNNKNLYEKLDVLREVSKESIKELPSYIKENLRVSEIRKYQEEAFTNFITYFENENMRMKPSKTLFWMATGSGKTLIMAGLMLYLYKKGYRDFLFFVNNNNIIKKTINNFTDPADTKYLFADNISIDGDYIKINKIDTFDKTDPNAINILFTSIQGLHQDMSFAKENRMSLDTFSDRKIVLIADEAHHNTASTRRRGKHTTNDDATWENTINTVYNCNPNNVLLEFTASFDYQNEDIVKEYENKIIYNYDLRHFRNDKYSKEIDIMRTDLEVRDKCILAMVFSQYRLKLFQDNHINVKPCILFKAHQSIAECKENIEMFKQLVKNLTGKEIENVITSIDDEKINVVKHYFEEKNISYDSLANELRSDFSEEHIISANGVEGNKDNDAEKNQLALNSLEDANNPYRAIFEVKKLDEGWDVLNLFDIVRMYTSREGGETTVAPATMSEAQLIGRGARYYPFKFNNDDDLYKRKFDNDLDNPLRMCETLLYHCQTDSKYLSEIRKALIETGAIDNNRIICHYVIKDSFKENDIWKKGLVYFNKRIEKPVTEINGIDERVRSRIYQITIDTGLFGYSAILDDEINSSIDISKLKTYSKNIKEIAEINYAIVRKALMKYSVLSFNKLKYKYPNLKSTREFITSDNYMGNITIDIRTGRNELTNEILYKAVLKVASKLATYIDGIGMRYEGTHDFDSKPINSIFSNKTVNYGSVVINGKGEAQKNSSDLAIKIDLSKEDWFVYEENYGTREEKEFVTYFKKRYPEFKEKYDNVYLIRNERQLALYSFEDGDRFEPDYVLFLQKKNAKDTYDQLQVFIEPKGDHLLKDDEWKEKFLLQLQNKDNVKCEINMLGEDNNYSIWGVHFYNTNRNSLIKDFDKDIDKIIKGNEAKNNGIDKILSKELAAQIDVGKIAKHLKTKDDKK